MKRRQTTRGSKRAPDVEWIGGVISMPAYITGEDEPYRPEALFWMGADGAALGVTMARSGELLPLVGASLQSTIEKPMVGRPHAPTRVRVASPELAEALRRSHPALDIVCAPTPELDGVIALLHDQLDADEAEAQSYLSPEIAPEAMASFFEAAAGLFRAQPWAVLPDDHSLLSVTIEQLGVREAVISIIGQMGQSFGVLLFPSLDAFEAYLDAAELMDAGEVPKLPPHFVLNFEPAEELDPALLEEIVAHCWPIAGPDAHPWLAAIDEDLLARPPSARELTMAEAIARALTELLAEPETLRATWRRGEPVSRSISVRTHEREIEVSLRAPYQHAHVELGPDHDVLAELAALARHGDPSDLAARDPLEDELLRRFGAAPESQGLADLHACRFLMDFAADYFGATVATLTAAQLREILFEIIPRKLSIDASAAPWIIETNRAFYRYLKREHGLAQADACLKVLGGRAIEKLEAALGDSSKFGLAKSLLMAGRDAGFDLESRDGIEAWMESIQGKPLPPGIQLPLLGPSPAVPKPAKKKTATKKATTKTKTATKKTATKKKAGKGK